MKWNHYLLLPVLACCPMAEGCVFIGADPPRPNIPSIARHHSKWTAENHAGICSHGGFNGSSIRDLGIGIGGMEARNSEEWPRPIYSIYETYETKSAPYAGGGAFGAPKLQDTMTYLNRYDFYVDENDIVVKCVPHSQLIDKTWDTI